MKFQNRIHAATLLCQVLGRFKNEPVVVLSIPRGGVAIGSTIAKHFGWEHGLLLTKKIGHPLNPEYAIGAVGASMVYVDERHADVSKSYLESEIARIQSALAQREQQFLQGKSQPNMEGKTVIVVDDGIATGLTMRVSVMMLRKQHPKKIIVAVPVAPPTSVDMIKQVADEVIVLHTSADFSGVGQFYEDFSEVTDAEVMEVMSDKLASPQAGHK